MHFVGVDLAWGEKRRTGLAVLDRAGRLLELGTHTTDEDITAALASYTSGACLVAIDAPLVVTNATGNRPAEAALNRDFGRFHAGAHPSNTGKPEFAGTPRGARLAAALGLDIDPRSRSERRAIEVYPHPATIVLFGLGRTVKYKQRAGRTLPELRDELLRLMDLTEGLATSDPPLQVTAHRGWRGLRSAVREASAKSSLRMAEDQVDAVLCAYIAMFAEHRPQDTTVYGDLATGYIVTPTLTEGLLPEPRRAGAGEAPVQRAVQEYAARYPQTVAATGEYVDLVRTLLDDAGINYLAVSGRAKGVASFAGKANRLVDGRPLYGDPLRDITDQIGVRVVTYVLADVAAVADLLADQLTVLDDRDMAQETAQEGRWGYASRHLLVTLGQDGAAASHPTLAGRPASVQVRTVLQHAWAEFEHEVRYKGVVPAEHVPDLDRRFTLAAGLLELADQEFAAIRHRLRSSLPESAGNPDPTDPRISPEDLAAFLAGRFAEAGWSRTDHYAWISGVLLELGITSLAELTALLTSVDSAAINERMGYRYPPGAVRRLDDALLAVFGDRYLALHGNADRVPLLRTRLARLRGES